MKQTHLELPNERYHQIIEHARTIFAQIGIEHLSMRTLAKSIGIAPSVLYYYFPDKDKLLAEMYATTNQELGQLRAQLPAVSTPHEKLLQLILFQFDQAERVVAVLKYYFANRPAFLKLHPALPPKATLHIEEVLEYGIKAGVYSPDSRTDVKSIAHIINGFLLEFYPALPSPKERVRLAHQIAGFIERAICHPHSSHAKEKN